MISELPEGAVEVPVDALEPSTVRRLIEEFVTREGTDYGHVDPTLESKVRDVERQLARGDAVIVFDPASETVGIVRHPARGR